MSFVRKKLILHKSWKSNFKPRYEILLQHYLQAIFRPNKPRPHKLIWFFSSLILKRLKEVDNNQNPITWNAIQGHNCITQAKKSSKVSSHGVYLANRRPELCRRLLNRAYSLCCPYFTFMWYLKKLYDSTLKPTLANISLWVRQIEWVRLTLTVKSAMRDMNP